MSAAISVVIPTYNRAGVLGRALDSVGRQTLAPLEVLIVDDGSEDATSRIVTEFYPECELLRQPNQGVSAARNRGVRAARGDWIAFLDSDDEWLPEKLAEQVAMLGAEPGCRIVHTDEIWIRNGVRVNPRRRHRKAGGWIFRNCLPLCAISPSSALLHRSIFDDVGAFDEDLPACEDYDFWLRCTAREAVTFVDLPLVIKHGGHADQLSRRVEALDRYRIVALRKLLDETALKPGDRAAAVATLLEKIAVYRAGAARRGRFAEAESLDRLAARFEFETPDDQGKAARSS